MNPILTMIAKMIITSAISDVYISVIGRMQGEIMMSLRMLRCKDPYAEYILSLLAERYHEESYIYSDLEGYVDGLIQSMGRPDISEGIETAINDIESEVMDFISGLGDMRDICISVFNTDELP